RRTARAHPRGGRGATREAARRRRIAALERALVSGWAIACASPECRRPGKAGARPKRACLSRRTVGCETAGRVGGKRCDRVMIERVDLSRFPSLPRRRVEQLAAGSPRVIDLASTFPLLFLMLACDCGPIRRRRDAIRLARLGKPLAEVAQAMALPLCLRRIPPEACRAPPVWVAWSPEAGPHLANHIPSMPMEAASWLHAIFYASRACSEAFGLWIARQRRLFAGPLDGRLVRPLALYAWHSREAGNPLSRLAAEPWSPEQGIKSAVAAAGCWLARLKLAVHCGGHPIPDTWLAPGRVAGYDFVALTTR